MKVIRILILGGVLTLAACKPAGTGGSAATDAKPSGPPVATVNGEPISREFFEFYVKGVTGSPRASSRRSSAISCSTTSYARRWSPSRR